MILVVVAVVELVVLVMLVVVVVVVVAVIVAFVVFVIIVVILTAASEAIAVTRYHCKCLNCNASLQLSILPFYSHRFNTLHEQLSYSPCLSTLLVLRDLFYETVRT